MSKRKYPLGERKDRIAKLVEYITSNPGCRRLNVQAHMNSLYGTTLSTQTISEYLRDMVFCEAVREKNGQFFITKNGELMIERFTREK
jgi:predicted transcriptional regulator